MELLLLQLEGPLALPLREEAEGLGLDEAVGLHLAEVRE